MIRSPSFTMTAFSGAWADSQALPNPVFDYVSAKWASSTTCLTVGVNTYYILSSVLRSTDSGYTWTDVTNVNAMQGYLLTDIAAGPADEFYQVVYVVTGRNPVTSRPNGVVYTSKDGKTFSIAKGLNGLVSPGAGLNGAAVGYNNMDGWTACVVVGVLGKIYRSYYDHNENDFISWADVSPIRMTVMRSLRCSTTLT